MSKLSTRLAKLEGPKPVAPKTVAIVDEGEASDADIVIELCAPKMDANGRALPGE